MRKFGSGVLIVAILLTSLFALIQPDVNASSARPPELAGKSAIVVDASSGTILFERNATDRLAPASLTKIFTSYFAIESTPMQRRMTVDTDDLVGEASAGLNAGENLSFETLLHGLLLASGNDAAMTIARNAGASRFPSGLDGVDSFISYVNDQLAALGISGTHLVNPHGLDADGHYSTARDVAAMTLFALQNEPDFLRIIGSPGYQGEGFAFPQRNQLFGNYPGALGGKTGITDNAGYCLMGIAKRDGRTIISVVMGSTPDAWYSDLMALLDHGFAISASPGMPSIEFVTQPATSAALLPATFQGLSVHAAGPDIASVRFETSSSAGSWNILRWPIGATLAMAVALVCVVQARALIELQQRPMASGRRPRTRHGARQIPSLGIDFGDTQQFPSHRTWDQPATSWSVSVGD